MKWLECLLLVGLTSIAASQAFSSDENLHLNASVGVFYDSNRYLAQDGGSELNGFAERARIRYSEDTEKTSWQGELSAVNEQIADFENSENDSIGLGFDGSVLFQRSRLYANLDIEKDSTLSTDVQAAGIFEENKDRLYSTTSAGYTYSLTEVDQLDLGLSAESVDYDEIQAKEFAEYVFYGGSVGYTRSFGEADRVQFSVFEDVLDNQYSGLISETQGFRTTWDHRITQAWRWKAAMGMRESSYEIETRLPFGGTYQFSDTNRSRVTDFEVDYDGEVSRVKLAGSYDLLPSSNGNLVARQSIETTWFRGWSPTRNSLMNITYWRQRSDLTTDSVDDLDTLQVSISYSWRFFRKLNAVFRYSRLERLLLVSDVQARSNFVGIDVAWMEDPISFP